MVYKSLSYLVPGYLSLKFVKRYETRYSPRDSVNKLIIPFPRTNFIKNSFSYSGAVVWNSLSCDMREAKSLRQFKRLAHLNFWFFKCSVHGIHEKQVLVRLVEDSFAYCLGQLGLFNFFLFSWWIQPCLNKQLFYSSIPIFGGLIHDGGGGGVGVIFAILQYWGPSLSGLSKFKFNVMQYLQIPLLLSFF